MRGLARRGPCSPASLYPGRMPQRAPHPALRGLVRAYDGYDESVPEGAVHHGIPSTTATVILAFGEPLDVGWLATPRRSDTFWALASGLHDAPALVHAHGRLHGIQLALSPAGVRRLLGLPMGGLGAFSLVEHGELPLGLRADDVERLAAAPTWAARFDTLDAALLSALAQPGGHGPRSEVGRAWQLLRASRGRLGVRELAGRVGMSERHLGSCFRAEFGLSPKRVARLRRFEHADALRRRGIRLSDVATEAGYADQSHLTRDWRALTGHPPTDTAEFRFVQESPHPTGQG